MQRSTRRFSTVLAVTVLGLGLSGFASAEDALYSTDERKAAVPYGDLNLNNPEDAKRLYERIALAAGSVCRRDDYGPSTQIVAQERACSAKAVDDAVRSIAHPNLLAAYEQHQGKRAMVASSR